MKRYADEIKPDDESSTNTVQSKSAGSSINQSKLNWLGIQICFDQLLTIYLTTGGGDLRHTEVGGANDVIVTGSVPGMRK